MTRFYIDYKFSQEYNMANPNEPYEYFIVDSDNNWKFISSYESEEEAKRVAEDLNLKYNKNKKTYKI